MIKSTGIDFFTFYATTSAVKCNHQLVVATTGAFTLTSVNMGRKLLTGVEGFQVVSAVGRFGHESFRPWVASAGSFRPGLFRPDFRVGRFGLFW